MPSHPNQIAAPARVASALSPRRLLGRLLTVVVALTAIMGVTAGVASANQWNGLLYGGTQTITAGTQNTSGGYVYGANAWTAPSGTNFGGFAYTSAGFVSYTSDSVGAISAGFGGDGSANQPNLLFPWTSDCAVSNVGHYWAYSYATTKAGTSGNANCSMTGSTGGWNFTNSEIYNTSPGVNPQINYGTLWLSVYCQAATCTYAGNSPIAAEATVTNLSGNFNDPWNTPAGGISWNGLAGSWVQTNTGSVSVSASASDPAGVCDMYAAINGPQSVSSGLLGDQNPGVTNVGGVIGTEFQYGTNPCWVGTTNTGTWPLPGGLASGTYTASTLAANPGNYAGQGFNWPGSPTVATSGGVNIDDQTPSASMTGATGTGAWTTATTANVNINTGPSGLSSVSCTDNGAGVGATQTSANGNSYSYSVPLHSGSNTVQCSAANGDGNGALVGNSSPAVYQQDVTVPSVQFTDAGYNEGTWSGVQQTVTVRATGGPSGVSGLSCKLDGNSLPDSYGDTMTVGGAGASQTANVTIPANGAHNLSCSADNAGTPGIVGSGSYTVDVDSQVPQVAYLTGGSYAATSAQAADPSTASGQNWINGSGNVTIGITGTEPAIVSGVQTMVCTVNGVDPQTFTNSPSVGTIAQATPFTATFTASAGTGWLDNQNVIACQGTTPAGITGADGTNAGTVVTEYVDVNDATLPVTEGGHVSGQGPGTCGISTLIDNGGCAYSNGPSQTAWESTSQTVTITADDTGNPAPITSITCAGAPMAQSSWTAPQGDDSNNGMTVTATITAPGGKFDCQASDSASPQDTWDLGSYNVNIDPSAPSGHFEPQGYAGAAKNIIQIDLGNLGKSLPPSGIKSVSVQGKDTTTGKTFTGGQLTGNPADGSTAYATLDATTHTYNLTVDPQVFGEASDTITFTAVATTNALPGVSATINTNESGDPEQTTAGGLGAVDAPVPWYSTTGDNTTITSTIKAGKWSALGAGQASLFASLAGTASNPIAPTKVATVASQSAKVCKTVKAKRGKGKAAAKPKRSCRVIKGKKAPKWEALPAAYGQKLPITGVLYDTQGGGKTPIANAQVIVYVTDLVSGKVTKAGTVTTGARGGFSFKLNAGSDRRIDLVYVGTTGKYQGADTATDTTTAGKLHMSVPRSVKAGQKMHVTGRVYGGAMTSSGALAKLQYLIVGPKNKWANVDTYRVNGKTGKFSVKLPIQAGSAGHTYRFRVAVLNQAGWGFRGATSNVSTVHVS